MSDRMNPEDRLRDAISAYTESVDPAPDAWARIRARVDRSPARERRGRGWQLSLAGFAAAATVVLVVVGLIALRSEDDGGPNMAGPGVTTTPTEPTAGDRREPLPNFVAVKQDGRVVVITNADGREREIADGADAETTLAVTPDGKGVYLDRPGATSSECGPNREIVFAPVKGGKTRVIAKNAADPAVSPDGKQLAYVGYQDSSGCGNPRSLVVEKARKNGRASSGKSWASPAEDGGVVAPSWAPDSRHVHFLFVGGNGIVTSQVLDTDQAQSLDDAQPIALPADVRPYGYFGATGELLGVDFTGPSSIVVIDPDTGGISRVLFPVSDRIFAPQSATASARGQNVLYLAPGPEGRIGLYVWQAVAPTPVAFTEGILAATFLPIDQER